TPRSRRSRSTTWLATSTYLASILSRICGAVAISSRSRWRMLNRAGQRPTATFSISRTNRERAGEPPHLGGKIRPSQTARDRADPGEAWPANRGGGAEDAPVDGNRATRNCAGSWHRLGDLRTSATVARLRSVPG